MSRHQKIRALNYEDEYDDYYGAFDDDDFDEDAFETQYLNSGIDLTKGGKNNSSEIDKSRKKIIDEVQSKKTEKGSDSTKEGASTTLESSDTPDKESQDCSGSYASPKCPNESRIDDDVFVSSITSDLTKIAIKHLDERQWQLPLLEMDKRFRDKTYYKHYSDTYISSLRSKLGHFLADNQLISNPMRYHIQQELDNYSKYSRMLEMLTQYYQSLGGGFFSFATPSPDEEIVIGCRLGTKVKKQTPKKNELLNKFNDSKPTRFEYSGKGNDSSQQPSNSKSKKGSSSKAENDKSVNIKSQDLTVQENFTAEQLERLSAEYQNSLKIEQTKQLLSTNKPESTSHPSNNQNLTTKVKELKAVKKPKSYMQPGRLKPLESITDKRKVLQQQLKINSEPSAQDLDTFKRRSMQNVKEYNDHMRNSRPRINLIVVGHVDAGKSTLVGHLLFKLGRISGKQMHRNEVDSQRSGKASFKFAWAMDETAEERARGVTIDIALTKFETPNRDVILLDAPGHVDFIPAVISGAAQADAALLVVDATRGEFETGFTSGGQTREHTFLVKSLGVKSVVVVVNKMDNIGWNWSRFSDIVDQLRPFLKQVGYNIEKDVQFVACSGLTGENMVERRIVKKLKASSHPQLEGDGGNWGEMPSLLEAIDNLKQPERSVDKPTRVFITDVYKGMSSGVFLGGKVVSGKVENKQKLLLLPPNESCELKQIEAQDKKVDHAFAGDIVTVVVTGIELNKFYRGCMLCDPIFASKVTNRFQARIIMFQNISAILIKGTNIEVHLNGTFESGQVRKLISLLDKSSGELIQRRPRCIARNSSAILQIRLDRVVCCELYEDNKDLGRFTIRLCGKTIAAGLITKIKSPKTERSKTKMNFK